MYPANSSLCDCSDRMKHLQFSVHVLGIVAQTQGSTGSTTEGPACSGNEKFLTALRAMLTSYLGETTMMTMFANLQAQQVQQAQQTQATTAGSTGSGSGGAVFTRWGRPDCPPGNEFVYKGYTAGNAQGAKAGPATTLCLPERPIYANYTPAKATSSFIYGTEYKDSNLSPNFKRLYNQDVPCAVCRTRMRSVFMVPARNECVPGWRLEYWGYLMSGYHNFGSSEYICVDVHAVPTVGGHEQKNGRSLYLAETVCGSLPCPPYQNFWEVTCAVCSKK